MSWLKRPRATGIQRAGVSFGKHGDVDRLRTLHSKPAHLASCADVSVGVPGKIGLGTLTTASETNVWPTRSPANPTR